MKIATWNVNSLSVRLEQVLNWLANNPVDVLVLQEIKMTDDKFPFNAFAAAGYQGDCFGQKTYNGVAILSRWPVTDIIKNIPGFEDPMARVISGTVQGVRVVGGYFPNGQAPDSDKFVYKLKWLSALRNWLEQELQRFPKLVLLGDFNITFDDQDCWDPVGMHEQIHCTQVERDALQDLVELGLYDSFRQLNPNAEGPGPFSWWDYRAAAFPRNRGLRIDHVLVSTSLMPLARSCVIDVEPRRNERPSDHAPVILSLACAV